MFRRPSSMLAPSAAAAAVGERVQLRSAMSYTLDSAASITAAAAAGGLSAVSAAPEGAMFYDEVRVRYECSGSIALGFYRSSNQELVLNPVKGAWCEPGDVLIALTRSEGG